VVRLAFKSEVKNIVGKSRPGKRGVLGTKKEKKSVSRRENDQEKNNTRATLDEACTGGERGEVGTFQQIAY